MIAHQWQWPALHLNDFILPQGDTMSTLKLAACNRRHDVLSMDQRSEYNV